MEVKIKYLGGHKFIAEASGRKLIIDQPKEKCGSDEGMSPLEIFLTALGSCAGVYAQRYCQNAGIEAKDLEVSVSSSLTKDLPLRFQDIDVKISLSEDIAERKKALLSFVNNCPVHNTLKSNPNVNFVV